MPLVRNELWLEYIYMEIFFLIICSEILETLENLRQNDLDFSSVVHIEIYS